MTETEDHLRHALSAYGAETSTSPDAWERVVARAERQRAGARAARLASAALATAVLVAGVVVAVRHRPAENALALAAHATAAERRFGFTYAEDFHQGGSVLGGVTAEGQYDLGRRVGWVRRADSDPARGAEIVFDAAQVLVRSDLLSSALTGGLPPAPWVGFDRTADAGQLGLLLAAAGLSNVRGVGERIATGDPFDALILDGATLVNDGTENVRGVPASRYLVHYDEARLLAAMRRPIEARLADPADPGRARDQALLQALTDHPEQVRSIETTVWIDRDGLLRRYRVARDVPAPNDPSATTVRSALTVELFDLGAALNPDVPAQADVTPVGGLRLPALTTTTLASGGAAHPTDSGSFFQIRAVLRQVPAPCPAGSTFLPQVAAGSVVACYEVGPAGVDAQDVVSATAVQDAAGAWAVEFTLTAAGAAQFNRLGAGVGVGGQLAIVVDGVVTTAPRLDTTSFPGKGRIAGLDATRAQELAARLHR